MTKNRMEALSDGIFAIALTILVLEIKLPHDPSLSLPSVLLGALPKVLSFALSFVIIGMYWVAHHQMTHGLVRVDRPSLWLNLLTLLFVCFIPFPTALLGDYPRNPIAVCAYCANLVLVNGSGTMFWLYANRLEGNGPKNRKIVARVAYIHMSPAIVYLGASAIAFFNYYAALVLLAVVPLFFLVPHPLLDRAMKE